MADCRCMECRIRQAIQGIGPDEPPRFLDGGEMSEAINSLGNIMAEYLAHTNTRTAKIAVAEILEARKRWQKHPRVAVQLTEGNA